MCILAVYSPAAHSFLLIGDYKTRAERRGNQHRVGIQQQVSGCFEMYSFLLKYYLIIIIISIFSVSNAHSRLLLYQLGHLSAGTVQGLSIFHEFLDRWMKYVS